MTKAQHTPGPWWPVKESSGGFSVKTYRDRSDCTPQEDAESRWQYGANICMSIGDHTEKHTSGNEKANASLIAAAPDMLEALISIEEYWNQDRNDQAMFDACWHAIDTARAAITKAVEPTTAA